jgi:ABC-2 type transport system ATP-binding protein
MRQLTTTRSGAMAAAPTRAAAAFAASAVATASSVGSAASAAAPLAAEAITVRYGRRTAVENVSLALREGAVYALLGRNGAGKSSLVRCLLGQQRATAGRALLFGRDAWRHRASLMAQVGVVPEHPDAPPAATARQLARCCRPLYARWDATGFADRLRRFGVPADLPFGRLSKGQQRHVALALALAGSPRLLILDDPTLGLGVVARRAFFEELVGELADRGTTVFLTTHDLAAVERIADRAGILAGGRLLVDEDVERLKQRFRRIWLPGAQAGGAEAAGGPAAAAPTTAPTTAAAIAAAIGPDLEEFAPVARVRRDWGVEAVVAAFDDARFRAWQGGAAASAAEVSALTLEEIFVALAGDAGTRPAAPATGDAP